MAKKRTEIVKGRVKRSHPGRASDRRHHELQNAGVRVLQNHAAAAFGRLLEGGLR